MNERGEKKAQVSIFEKAGYGAYVSYVDDHELLQSFARKDNLDKREK